MQAEARAQQAQALAQEQVMQAEAQAQQAQTALNVHVAQLHAVYASTSWQITAPLRRAVQQLRLLRTHGFKQRGKAAAKKALRKVVPWIAARPALRRMATQVAYKLGLAERLKPLVRSFFVYQQPPSPQHSQQQALADLITLTPRAEHFYKQIKQSGEKLLKGLK
jgi:hypothetical protein